MIRIYLITVFLIANVFAQQNKYNKVSELLSNLPEGASCSIKVLNPETDSLLYSNGNDEAMIPASNIKLFTTAALLHYLGEDFEINTEFLTDDFDLSDSVVNGDLYIKGLGDPSLNYDDIDSVVADLKEMGIKRIDGDIIGDESAFDSNYTRDDWITNEKANVVLPPISALSMNRNSIYVRLIRNKSNRHIDYEVIPNYNFISVKMNKAYSKKNKVEPTLHQNNDGIQIEVKTSNNLTFSRRYLTLHVKDPALYFAQVVKAELEIGGISVYGQARSGISNAGVFQLAAITTKLGEILNYTNKHSNNYYAECLFKLLGWAYSGESGNSFYATQAINEYLNQIGINTDELEILDGSGISRFNKLTTEAVVELLAYTYNEEDEFPVYLNSLAIGATDGTLQDRFTHPETGKYFRGKTGTLNGVSSISGYLTTIDNEDLVISILMEFNRYGANYYRKIQDDIIEVLIGLQ